MPSKDRIIGQWRGNLVCPLRRTHFPYLLLSSKDIGGCLTGNPPYRIPTREPEPTLLLLSSLISQVLKPDISYAPHLLLLLLEE